MSEVIILEVAEPGPPGPPGPPGQPSSASGGLVAERNPNLIPYAPPSNSFEGFIFTSSSNSLGGFDSPASQPRDVCYGRYGFNSDAAIDADQWIKVELPVPKAVGDIHVSVSGEYTIALEYSDNDVDWFHMKTLTQGGAGIYIPDADGQPHKFFRVIGRSTGGGVLSALSVASLVLRTDATFGVLDFGSGSTGAEAFITPVSSQTALTRTAGFFLRAAPTADNDDNAHAFAPLDCALTHLPDVGVVRIQGFSRTLLYGKYHVGYI